MRPRTSAVGVQRTRVGQKVPSIRRRRLVPPDHEAVKHSLHATIVKLYRELGAVRGNNCAVAELFVEFDASGLYWVVLTSLGIIMMGRPNWGPP